MIVRHLCVRQSRQLFALNRQAYNLRRFSSVETPTSTPIETAAQTPTEEPVIPVPTGDALQFSTAAQSMRRAAYKVFKQKETRRSQFQRLGTDLSKPYNPEDIITNPPHPRDITLELLLAAQTHLGHSTSRWNPQNSRYIFGIRDNIHIISLDVTAAYLRRAARVVEEVAARGGLILFVGTRDGQKRSVVRAAELAGGYHIFERWIPGSLTNGEQILGHCEMKVVNALDEELPQFNGTLKEQAAALKPDLVVCLNPIENVVLLHECGLNSVPTIGIIDTDADPTRVTYPIPANDDSLRSAGVIAGVLGRAGQAGQSRRLREAKLGNVEYRTVLDRSDTLGTSIAEIVDEGKKRR
ncbi:ribosomal protein S2, flavodoxin-like domain-containing protein [Aspergillus cavernicola]|uniref:Ribosomal protein S2, flavodoxin-like domain-containing protein n=1 Tax=Aspergillus cavernicola TaxID=176166 RepID=A0ABR4IA93_9EURO